MKVNWTVVGTFGGLIAGLASLVVTVVSTVDQIKNGDKRAMITGYAAGQRYYECQNGIQEEQKNENTVERY